MDQRRMEEGIRQFVEAIAERFPGDDLDATPARVARAWHDDLLSGYAADADREMSWTEAPHDGGEVVVRNIDFASVCVHHLLPFVGRAHVAYLPGDRLAGLSKIGRVVEIHARRLQIQEHLTSEIVGTLDRTLQPHGVLVMLEAEHTCMTLRGTRKKGSRLVTLGAAGLYRDDRSARREILQVIAPGRDEIPALTR